MQNQTLVWRSGNSAGHMNKVKLRRATRLVLGLLTAFGRSNLPSIFTPLRPTQPGHPFVGRCSEYWRWFRPPLGKKLRVLRISGPCYQDCWHTRRLIYQGDELPHALTVHA